jgi:hypothetical protein
MSFEIIAYQKALGDYRDAESILVFRALRTPEPTMSVITSSGRRTERWPFRDLAWHRLSYWWDGNEAEKAGPTHTGLLERF